MKVTGKLPANKKAAGAGAPTAGNRENQTSVIIAQREGKMQWNTRDGEKHA